MTRIEMTNKLEKLEHERFILAMKDTWNYHDYDEDRELLKAINELKKALKN